MRFLDFLFEKEEVEIEPKVVKPLKPEAELKVNPEQVAVKPKVAEDNLVQPIETKERNKGLIVDEEKPKQAQIKMVEKQRPPYQFSSPISPIFGALDKNEGKPSHHAPTSRMAANKSRLGTVLSPYFGQGYEEAVQTQESLVQQEYPAVTADFEAVIETDDSLEEATLFDELTLDDIIKDEISEPIQSDKRVINNVENISLFDGEF